MTGAAIRGVTVPGASLQEALQGIHAETSANEVTPILARLCARKSYDSAFYLAQAGFDRWRTDASFLRTYRSIVTQLGLASEATVASYYLSALGEISSHSLRHAEGRVKELSGWQPTITANPVRLEPALPNRVLHLVKESRPRYSNGFTSRSHYNFLAEREAGLQPIVMTEPGASRIGDLPAPRIEHYDGIVHHHLDIPSLDMKQVPIDEYLNLFAELAFERIKDIRPALIHVSSGRRGYETALVGLALKRHTGLPLVYEVRSFFESNWTANVEREEQGEIYSKRNRVEEEVMRAADLVLTIGSAMEQELVRRGVPSEKVGIIPNGVDTQLFQPIARDPALAKKFGLSDEVTFGYVSNMDHHRESQETLIQALRHATDRGHDLRCVLVGDGPRRSLLESLAHNLGVQERVIFTGKVDHSSIQAYYGLIDIFVVPRTNERAARFVTPLKPFEAMAMKKPVVVSDLPALREITQPPIRGLSFPPDDASKLADTLGQLVGDTDLRERIADAGYQWVIGERTWAKNGERYREYFNQLLGWVNS